MLLISFGNDIDNFEINIIAPCDEIDAMEPSLNNPLESTSNDEDLDLLRSNETESWESNPQEDNEPTITVTVSETDSVVKSLSVKDSENIDSITVTVYNSTGEEVNKYIELNNWNDINNI